MAKVICAALIIAGLVYAINNTALEYNATRTHKVAQQQEMLNW